MSQTTEQIQKSDIKDILENSLKGNRPGPKDILRLLESDDVHLMGLVSGYLTKKQFGNKASFVNNIILNYTNVCITDCKFCAFYRSPGAEDSYTLSLDEIETRVKTSYDMFKIRQVLIQGGHNPNLKIEYYEDAFKMMRKKFPTIGVHGLSTSEIDMIATVEKSSTKEILSRLKDAGLQSVPGAGAEILTDSVKEIISPKKTQHGTRKFSAKDIEKFELIYALVKQRGFTLEGAKKQLTKGSKGNLEVLKKLQKIRQELLRIKAEL